MCPAAERPGIASGASLKDLFRLYRESPNFKRLAPKTRKEYDDLVKKYEETPIVARLRHSLPELTRSVSVTTRPQRRGAHAATPPPWPKGP